MKPRKEKQEFVNQEPINEPLTEQPIEEKTEFVNPFNTGVTYADFVKAVGEKSVREYCGENLTDDQIEWLEIEIEHFKNK